MENSSTQHLNQNLTGEDGKMPCFYSGISETLQSAYFYNTNLIFTPVTILLGLWCFLSNGSVLFVVLRSSFRKRAAFLMLCSLTLSDFLWGGVVTPMYIFFRIREFVRGRVCSYVNDLNNYWYYIPFQLCLFGTIGNLAVISVDRYLAVAKAMWYKVSVNLRHAFVACTCVWLFPILLVTLKLIGVVPNNWVQLFKVCFLALTSATIAIIQLITMHFFFKHNSIVAELTSNTVNAATAAMERRLTVATSYVVGVLLVVVIPGCLVSAGSRIFRIPVYLFTRPLFLAIITLYSGINPVIYYRHNAHIRNGIQRLANAAKQNTLKFR